MRRLRRQVAYGVYEGARPGRHEPDVWGGALAPDLEVADAEAYAILAYLQHVVARAGSQAATRRVLILSLVPQPAWLVPQPAWLV